MKKSKIISKPLMARRNTVSSKNKTRTIIPYKSYMFRNKDPVIDIVRTTVQDAELSHEKIHVASGVSTTTLHNWFKGSTRRPQFASVQAVMHSLGFSLEKQPFLRKKKR